MRHLLLSKTYPYTYCIFRDLTLCQSPLNGTINEIRGYTEHCTSMRLPEHCQRKYGLESCTFAGKYLANEIEIANTPSPKIRELLNPYLKL